MKRPLVVAFAAICFLAPVQTFAVIDPEVDGYTDAELVQIFKDDGYSNIDLFQKGAISVEIDGKTYVLINHKDGDLQGYYSIRGADISYGDINEWNRTKRLSRAYLDSDGDSVIESDLLSDGGLTKRRVTEFFKVFRISVGKFRTFIVQHNR